MKRVGIYFLYAILSSILIALINSLTGFSGQASHFQVIVNDVMWEISGAIGVLILFFPFREKKIKDPIRGQNFDLFLASLESEGEDEEETA